MSSSSGILMSDRAITCFKIPLKPKDQIIVYFLMPAVVNCLLYIMQFAADFVVAMQHFKEQNFGWGWVTLAFICAPAVVYFLLTIARPDWWRTEEEESTSELCIWFLLQLSCLVAFPLYALFRWVFSFLKLKLILIVTFWYRHATLIVLSFDALRLTGDSRKKTLNLAAAPSPAELYFFLQAWFQAVPQAFFQTFVYYYFEREIPRTRQSGEWRIHIEITNLE